MLWNADILPYFHSFDFYNWPCGCKTPEHNRFYLEVNIDKLHSSGCSGIFTSMMQCSEKFAKNSISTSQTPQASACCILKFMTMQKRLNMYDLFGRVTRTKPLFSKENTAAQLGLDLNKLQDFWTRSIGQSRPKWSCLATFGDCQTSHRNRPLVAEGWSLIFTPLYARILYLNVRPSSQQLKFGWNWLAQQDNDLKHRKKSLTEDVAAAHPSPDLNLNT